MGEIVWRGLVPSLALPSTSSMTEGFDALTMQRLADECDAAVGAVYRYFPSKGALVAEVQREAIDRLATAMR